MDIKHIRRFHELLYCAVLGSVISAILYLITGMQPGVFTALSYGWLASNLIDLAAEKKKVAQVKNLKLLHDQPAREQDDRNNEKK